MIFSNSYDGAYPRDLAHGFFDAGVQLSFISLGNAATPKWVTDYFASDYSKQFKANYSYVRKIIVTLFIIKKFKPDVIQTHLFEGSVVGLIAGRLASIPVVHTRHHIDEHYQNGTFLHRFVDRVVAKYSSHVIVCSEAAKKWLIDIEGIQKTHITVINQGFDFNYLDPSPASIAKVRHQLNFSESQLNVICVARYSKVKGQNYLLLALIEIIKTIPNISLTFMGPGDSDWLVKMVDNLGLEAYVKILPSRNDVPACIAASDLIIHPSLADSFSQLLIEAQAVGGLLIASDIAAAREQILDGVTGLIVPPRDPQAIVRAVQRLIGNRELAATLRSRGPIHVREEFSWQRMVKEELSCLEKFANKT